LVDFDVVFICMHIAYFVFIDKIENINKASTFSIKSFSFWFYDLCPLSTYSLTISETQYMQFKNF
jgi:hypothetical protein